MNLKTPPSPPSSSVASSIASPVSSFIPSVPTEIQIIDNYIKRLKEIFPTYSIILTKLSDSHLQLKMSSSKNDFASVITEDVSNKLEELFHTSDISMVGYRNKNSALTNLRTKRQTFKDHMCVIDVKNFRTTVQVRNQEPDAM